MHIVVGFLAKPPPISKAPLYEMSEEEFLGRLGALNIA